MWPLIIENILKTGIYKNGYGISCKLPSSEFDRYYIFKAIGKRLRKSKMRAKETNDACS